MKVEISKSKNQKFKSTIKVFDYANSINVISGITPKRP